jgi:hypothetical protein
LENKENSYGKQHAVFIHGILHEQQASNGEKRALEIEKEGWVNSRAYWSDLEPKIEYPGCQY